VDAAGETLVCGTTVSDLVLFKLSTRVFRASLPVGSGAVLCLAASATHVFVGCGDGVVRALRGRDGAWACEGEARLGDGRVVSLSLSRDQSELVAGTDRGSMFRLLTADLGRGAGVVRMLEAATAPVTAVAFGARSDLVATLSCTGLFHVWDLSDYRTVARGQASLAGGVTGGCLLFTRGDELLVGGFSDGSIRAHASATGSEAWTLARAHRNAVSSLAETATYIVSGGEEGCVRVWARATRELLLQFVEHRGRVVSVRVDVANPALVYSCGVDRAIFAYSLKARAGG
jgi:WD40 repeat protein